MKTRDRSFFLNQLKINLSIIVCLCIKLSTFPLLSYQLMMLVDYGGSIFPIIAHAPWNGIRLADFVMPFFLFIAGVSLALVYKVPILVNDCLSNIFSASLVFD